MIILGMVMIIIIVIMLSMVMGEGKSKGDAGDVSTVEGRSMGFHPDPCDGPDTLVENPDGHPCRVDMLAPDCATHDGEELRERGKDDSGWD